MRLLADLVFAGKKVFLRADLDVSVGNLKLETGNSKQDQAMRLVNLKPTVEYLLEHGAQQIFIAGHIGRPKQLTVNSSQFTGNTGADKPEFYDPELSTSHLEAPLEAVLRRSVTYKRDFNLDDGMLSSMAQIILFENLRFWPGEEENDLGFAKQLAALADIYVNDAFATCHRIHASVVALPQLFSDVEDPEGHRPRRAAGLHLAREVEVLEGLLTAPKRPFVVIIGGAKIETKVPVIENLAKIADWVLVGGEIALESQKSKVKSQNYNSKVIIADLLDNTKDIDQASIEKFTSVIKTAKTVVWNGPMGVFEEGFEAGSVAVASAIVESGSFSVVGGGETTQFLASKNLLSPPAGEFSFVSSGGGAMLEFLSGKELPGLVALQ